MTCAVVFQLCPRHVLFLFFMRMRGIFSPRVTPGSPRVTRARKKRTLTGRLKFITEIEEVSSMVLDGLVQILISLDFIGGQCFVKTKD